jgi:hypothetical protein
LRAIGVAGVEGSERTALRMLATRSGVVGCVAKKLERLRAPATSASARSRVPRKSASAAGFQPARAEADAIRLELLLAAIRRQREAGDGAAGVAHRAAEARAHDAEQAARHAKEDGERRGRAHAAHRVALDDVRHLVRDHAGQLVLAVRQRQQAAGDVDPAAGDGEGIGVCLVGHVPLPVDVSAARRLRQAPADRSDILDGLRIAHEPDGALDLLGLLAADLPLLLRRHRETTTCHEPAEHRGELNAAPPPGEPTAHGRMTALPVVCVSKSR